MKLTKKSKRQTLKLKYSIEKKVREHKRKMRSTGNSKPLRKKSRKDPGIPNNWPFKAQMLQDIQRAREEKVKERARLRAEKRQQAVEELDKLDGGDGDHNMIIEPEGNEYGELSEMATKKQNTFAESDDREATGDSIEGPPRKVAFLKTLRKVIEQCDVILEVVDARDPQGCRSPALERQIVAANKKLVILINKVDLVPRDAVVDWLKYLRREFPTLGFKSVISSGTGRPVISTRCPATAPDGLLAASNQVVGAKALMSLLKNYARSSGGNLSVGVIGFPNVGKSSVIKSLKRSTNAAAVSATAGSTRVIQEIQLDSKVKLVDSPGVIFLGDKDDAATILRNAVALSTVKDPVKVVADILQRCPMELLMKSFKVGVYKDVMEFLAQVARHIGRMGKGGTPNYDATARHIISQWTSGKIGFCVRPPKIENDEHATSTVVECFAPTLNLDSIWNEDVAGNEMVLI